MSMPASRQANEGYASFREGREELLPGIPDEITLHQIISKLPWKALYLLSLVNRAWLHGIRSRQFYDARVVSKSTETLITVCSWKPTEDGTRVGLFSTKDNSGTMLPPAPYYGDKSQWVCSDGKIYLLAAESKDAFFRVGPCSNKVFVFDVAGLRQWKECASMIEPRTQFACGIHRGKIYVFGGMSSKPKFGQFLQNPSTFCGAEVYDPKEDRWSPIRPMTDLRFDHRVLTVGDELFVLGGMFFDRGRFESRKMINDNVGRAEHSTSQVDPDVMIDDDDRRADSKTGLIDLEMLMDDDDSGAYSSDDSSDEEDDERNYTLVAKSLDVYNPARDEWRVVNPFGRDTSDFLFSSRGKLYSMDWSNIYVYDGKDNSWTQLHSLSFPSIPVDSVLNELDAVLAMDDHLFVKASWLENGDTANFRNSEEFEGKGFGSGSEELVWQISHGDFSASQFPESSNTLIQL